MSQRPRHIAVCSTLVGWGLLLPAGLMAQAPAAQVYRCGPGQYSATPCPGGTPIAGDARTAEQQDQARDIARRQQQLADGLRQERLQREQAAVGQRAAAIKPAPRASAGPGHQHRDKADPRPRPPKRKPVHKPTPVQPAASAPLAAPAASR